MKKLIVNKVTLWKSKKDGQFYFHFSAPNNQIILTSEGYKTKASATKTIKRIKDCLINDPTLEVVPNPAQLVFVVAKGQRALMVQKSAVVAKKVAAPSPKKVKA
jgi:uncharacterized protein YegP (UPF0339 family)